MKLKKSENRLQRALMLCTVSFANIGMASMPVFANNDTNKEVLTLDEAAEFLQVTIREVKTLAIQRQLPGRRIGKQQWRFTRQALLAWVSGEHETPVNNHIHPLDRTDLTQIAGRGINDTVSNKGTKNETETIGEKPKQKTADQVFLRDQGVLLKKGEMTLELGLTYSKSDRKSNITTPITTVNGEISALPDVEQTIFSSNYGLRYGIFDNLQFFASVPLLYRARSVSFQNQSLEDTSETKWGNLTTGLRYGLMNEGLGHPSVILSMDAGFPIDNGVYSVGGSVALTKSIDPAVLFANFGYRHNFNGSNQSTSPQASNQIYGSLGIAYALNDTLTLSTLISADFTSKTNLGNGNIIPSREHYSLQFGLTSYLTKGLYIEPYVSFGLNGNSSDVTIGLNLPYTFDW